MGLDVILCEPFQANIQLEPGIVNPQLLNARERNKLPAGHAAWTITEHWLMHVPAGPGTTFVAVLFPRRPTEPQPVIEYLSREETISIRHHEGRELIFLRPNPMVGTNIDGVVFKGRAGIFSERSKHRIAKSLDAESMQMICNSDDSYKLIS